VKYEFIARHRQQFHLCALCHVLQVSRSGFYEWRGRAPSARVIANRQLLNQIRRLHEQTREAYGAVKTWKALNQAGIVCGKHRVARLRSEAGMEARRKRRFRTTVEHHKLPQAAPDRVERHFHASQQNLAWVGDMTFIRTRAGWLYLAVLLDLYSRRVVGWSMGSRPNQALTLGALNMAIEQRAPKAGLIHHTDQGAIYRSQKYREQMAKAGILPSMGSKGSPHDNAVAESFFSNLKNELIHHEDFLSRESARTAIFSYIELFYNRQRIHQTLGYVSPVAFELATSEVLY
jgi:transposase InsO family protein